MAKSQGKGTGKVSTKAKAKPKAQAAAVDANAGARLTPEQQAEQEEQAREAEALGVGHERAQDPDEDVPPAAEAAAPESGRTPGPDSIEGSEDGEAGAEDEPAQAGEVDPEEEELLARLEQLRLKRAKEQGTALADGYVPKRPRLDTAPDLPWLRAGEVPRQDTMVQYRLDHDRVRKARIVEVYSGRILKLHVFVQTSDLGHGALTFEVNGRENPPHPAGLAIRDEVFEGAGIGAWKRKEFAE